MDLMVTSLYFSGIRQLQLMLLKIALIVGVEVHVNVEFVKLLEPPEGQGTDGNESSGHLSANRLALRTTLALQSPWCYLSSHYCP